MLNRRAFPTVKREGRGAKTVIRRETYGGEGAILVNDEKTCLATTTITNDYEFLADFLLCSRRIKDLIRDPGGGGHGHTRIESLTLGIMGAKVYKRGW